MIRNLFLVLIIFSSVGYVHAEKDINEVSVGDFFGYVIDPKVTEKISESLILCEETKIEPSFFAPFKPYCENDLSSRTRVVFLIKKFSFSGFEMTRLTIGNWIGEIKLFETDGHLTCSEDKTYERTHGFSQKSSRIMYGCVFSHSGKDYYASVLYFNPYYPEKETSNAVIVWNLYDHSPESKIILRETARKISEAITFTKK